MKPPRKKVPLGVLEQFTISLGFLVLSMVITITIPALLFTFSLLLYLSVKKVSLRQLLRFLRIPLAFAIIGLLSIVLVLNADENNSVFTISERYIPLSITVESLKHGEIVLWRVLNSLLSLYLLIATTTVKEKNVLADKLRVPKSLIELGVLSFRYIQLLDKKKQEIQRAQQLRLGYVSYSKSFRSSALLLSSVFIYSITTFRMNYQALLTRGYAGVLYYSDTSDLPKDRWWFIAIVVLGLLIFLLFYQMFL